MKLFHPPSIKLKLTFFAALTSTISLLIAAFGFIYYDLTSFKTKMKADMTTETKVIGANCGAPLVFGDDKALSETLSSLEAQHDIQAAAVYSSDGKLVAHYGRPGAEMPAASISKSPDRAFFAHESLRVFRSIYSDQDAVGTLFIQSDLSAWYARRNRYLVIVTPLVAGCIAISLILGSR